MELAIGQFRGSNFHTWFIAVVGVVAIATAIHRADPDCTTSSAIGAVCSVTRIDTQHNGCAVITLHRACYVVAAIDGTNAVAIDNDHLSLALHIGHAATAKDGTSNYQARLLQCSEGMLARFFGGTFGFDHIGIFRIKLQTREDIGSGIFHNYRIPIFSARFP